MQSPILIVGAGPTGLVLALWLAKSGVAFRIIEKNSGPGQASRAMAAQARTLEFYRQLGIADQVIDSGIRMNGLHLRDGSRKQMDIDVHHVNWFSTYHVHHRVADHFRKGRAFIAGDAGHIHSPAGGQGMNTGIGDAVNLAWKLAAVIRDRAQESILDTYESERIAFARSLVATTDRLFQSLVGHGLSAKIFRGIFLRHIAPFLLHFRAARRTQFRLVSQTRIHYHGSALSSGRAGSIRGGDRLPWLHSQDNFRSLNSLDWQLHVFGTPTDALRTLAAQWGLPIHSFKWDTESQSAGFVRDGVYFVRPDGHIALAQPDQDTGHIELVIAKWMRPHSATAENAQKIAR